MTVGAPELPRLPFAPLKTFLASLVVIRGQFDGDNGNRDGLTSIWDHNSAEYKSYGRAQQRGFFTTTAADRIAMSLGLHPAQIWGDAWFEPYLSESA